MPLGASTLKGAFRQGVAVQVVSLAMNRPHLLLKSAAHWLYHVRKAAIRGASYSLVVLLYRAMASGGSLVPVKLRQIAAAFIGGMVTQPLMSASVFFRSLRNRLFKSVPAHVLFYFVSSAFGYQLWAQAHHFPSVSIERITVLHGFSSKRLSKWRFPLSLGSMKPTENCAMRLSIARGLARSALVTIRSTACILASPAVFAVPLPTCGKEFQTQ
jgi:hypothetical protein